VNTPVPTMLAITRIVAEGSPMALLSSPLFTLFFNDHIHFSQIFLQIRSAYQNLPMAHTWPPGNKVPSISFWVITDS